MTALRTPLGSPSATGHPAMPAGGTLDAGEMHNGFHSYTFTPGWNCCQEKNARDCTLRQYGTERRFIYRRAHHPRFVLCCWGQGHGGRKLGRGQGQQSAAKTGVTNLPRMNDRHRGPQWALYSPAWRAVRAGRNVVHRRGQHTRITRALTRGSFLPHTAHTQFIDTPPRSGSYKPRPGLVCPGTGWDPVGGSGRKWLPRGGAGPVSCVRAAAQRQGPGWSDNSRGSRRVAGTWPCTRSPGPPSPA